MLKLYLSFCDHVRMTEVHAFDSSLETIAPFPNIFSRHINQHGFIDSSSRSSDMGNYCLFSLVARVYTNNLSFVRFQNSSRKKYSYWWFT